MKNLTFVYTNKSIFLHTISNMVRKIVKNRTCLINLFKFWGSSYNLTRNLIFLCNYYLLHSQNWQIFSNELTYDYAVCIIMIMTY